MLSTTKFDERSAVVASSGLASRSSTKSMNGFGLAWDARRGRWISLVYRYVFPRSPFLGSSGTGSSSQYHSHEMGGGGRPGRFSFGPCKHHHLTIGQSPFTRQHHHHHHRHRRYSTHISSTALPTSLPPSTAYSDADPDDLLLLTSAADNTRRLDGTGDMETMETMLMNEFLSSAYLEPHSTDGYYGDEGVNGCTVTGGEVVAPSSPPPPLFLDGSCPIPDLHGLY